MEPTPPDADVDSELQSLATAVTREHLIVLCCGHSVVELVDEVARNLRGLGFAVEVVCGAEARTALLGRSSGGNEPTIYVVCVQGTLKEQVLKPLRQALATHGGPNQHLFVAVLDLSLPLAMVGQIRRFAEALERPRRRGTASAQERRQWREQLGPNSERVATRSYRALEVVGRAETGPTPAVDAVRRTGPQAIIGPAIGGGRPARIDVTSKYRAITGSLPPTTTEAPTERRRRRAHAPKVRSKPVAESRPPPPPPTVEARPKQTGETVVAPPPVAVEVTSSTTTTQMPPAPPVAAPPPRIVAMPAVGVDAPVAVHERSTLPYVLGGIGLVAAIGAGLWFGGVIGPKGDVAAPTKTAAAAVANTEPVVKATPVASPPAPTKPATPPPAEIAAPKIETPVAVPAAPPAAPPVETNTPPVAPPPEAAPAPTPPAADIDPAFAEAVAARRLRLTDHLYVTAFQVASGSWQSARAACDDLEVGDKGGFRLPHRRELQGIEAAGWLDREPHWSRTVPDDDKESAYVIHPSTGQLTVWSKDEDAAAVCVRAR